MTFFTDFAKRNSCIIGSGSLLLTAIGIVASPAAWGIVAVSGLAAAIMICGFYLIWRYLVNAKVNFYSTTALGFLFALLLTVSIAMWAAMILPKGAAPPIISISAAHLAIILAAKAVFSFCVSRKFAARGRETMMFSFAFAFILTSIPVMTVLNIARAIGLMP